MSRRNVIDDISQWVFLYGSRRLITLLLAVTIFLGILVVGAGWEFEMETLVRETRAVQTLFNTLLGGMILFVSVVVSINVAALAQDFTPLQVKKAHIEGSIEFQTELEELAKSGVSPAGLRGFYQFVLHAIRAETEGIRVSADRLENPDLTDELQTLIDDIEGGLSEIEPLLGESTDTSAGVSTLLLAGLDYNYARDINTVRRIQWEHRDELADSEVKLLEDLLEVLTILASGREYFTTLYFKRELRHLSRDLLVLSLPVLVFTSYVLLAIDARLFPTLTAFGIQARLLYVTLAIAVAISPYLLLSSYMFRVITVSKYSLESTSFTFSEED